MRRWRHLPPGRPAPGGLAAPGCGAVTGAAAARREGPPGPAGREGCARSRRRAAQHSPAGSSLQKSHTYAASASYGPRAA